MVTDPRKMTKYAIVLEVSTHKEIVCRTQERGRPEIQHILPYMPVMYLLVPSN